MSTRLFRSLVSIITLGVIGSCPAWSQVGVDVGGSQDIGMIGRYPGSFISFYSYSEYDELVFPTSINSRKDRADFEKKSISGERQVLIYDLPSTESNTLKVFRSLETKINEIGFTPHFSCSAQASGCGYFFPRNFLSKDSYTNYYKKFREIFNANAGGLNIYSGFLEKDGQEYHLILIVDRSPYSSYIQYSFDLVNTATLKKEEIVLSDDHMEREILETGKVVLDGLFFGNNSAVLTESSSMVLKTISEYISKRPQKKYVVVGHTDTKGGYEYNLTLSQGRADEVMKTLIKDYSIPSGRLKSVGVSYVAPTASNVSGSGREQNRRVELVEVDRL